jgi:predicted HicB family RNase H-like nuclease
MDDPHPIRLNISVTQARHGAAQIAAKRAGISLNKLCDIAMAELLERIDRDGALTLPLAAVS